MSSENTDCRVWFSLSLQDLPRWGLDTMSPPPKPWALMFAFPPLQLIHPLLERVKQEDLSLILVAPESRLALWFHAASWVVSVNTGCASISSRDGAVPHPPYLSVLASDWLILQGRHCQQWLSILSRVPSSSTLCAVKWSALCDKLRSSQSSFITPRLSQPSQKSMCGHTLVCLASRDQIDVTAFKIKAFKKMVNV